MKLDGACKLEEESQGLQASPPLDPSNLYRTRLEPKSWFSKLFGPSFRDPPGGRWPEIMGTIHSRLAEERSVFFKACVELIKLTPDARIQCDAMGPSVDAAITVFQLMLCREFLAARRYIQPANFDKFVEMFYGVSHRYGPEVSRSGHCTSRYERDDRGNELLLFYGDVATYITGKKAPLLEAMWLMENTSKRLACITCAAVASAFGDPQSVSEMVKKIQTRSE